MTFKKLVINSLALTFILTLVFFIHHYSNNFLGYTVNVNQLGYSYMLNLLMACGVVWLLFLLRRKFKDQLGFVFMAASMFKFLVFFICFYPEYNADGILSKMEFFTFFIPYAICLVLECVVLSKILNSLDA